MAIVINGSGTVTGLAVGGLPDGTVDAGTLATDSVVTGKIADGTIANADIADLAASKLTGALPAISGASLTGITTGKVLQVVMGTDTGYTTTTSSTYSDTGLSASITPATGSKVLVLISHGGLDKRGGASGYIGLKLFRSSTEILKFSGQFGYTAGTLIQSGGLSYSYLDASAGGDGSTAITYKTQFNSEGSITAGVHAGGETSTLTLIEIGA